MPVIRENVREQVREKRRTSQGIARYGNWKLENGNPTWAKKGQAPAASTRLQTTQATRIVRLNHLTNADCTAASWNCTANVPSMLSLSSKVQNQVPNQTLTVVIAFISIPIILSFPSQRIVSPIQSNVSTTPTARAGHQVVAQGYLTPPKLISAQSA